MTRVLIRLLRAFETVKHQQSGHSLHVTSEHRALGLRISENVKRIMCKWQSKLLPKEYLHPKFAHVSVVAICSSKSKIHDPKLVRVKNKKTR